MKHNGCAYVVHYSLDGEIESVRIENARDEREAANRAALRVIGAHGGMLNVVLVQKEDDAKS